MLNYTTKVPAQQSVSEISQMLARAGAKAIMQEFDEEGQVTSISFKMVLKAPGETIPTREIGFRLPAEWRAIHKILVDMRRKNTKIERHVATEPHAIKVTWRVIRDWIEAQLALIEADQVRTEQVFLPYAVTKSGRTLAEELDINPSMLLGPGDVQ